MKIKELYFRGKTFISEKASMLFSCKNGESYMDTAVKIIIALVLGALVLGGLYLLWGDAIMPSVKNEVEDMFNYS